MAFLFRLEKTARQSNRRRSTALVPNWRPGHTIPLGHRSLRVIDIRDDEADQPPVLVIEDVAE